MKHFKRLLSAILAIIMCLSALPMAGFATTHDGLNNFTKRNSFKSDLFTDISETNWFYDNVKTAYELGLMVGKGENTFDTESVVTIAETITIAARIHSIYYTGNDSFEKSTPWYDTYVDYAEINGVLTYGVNDYSKAATRAEFAVILANALPDEAFESANKVAANVIPDVKTTDAFGDAVYKLYRAGVMVGNDENGTFAPASDIKRSEVSAIVTRMADRNLRRSVQLGKEYTITFDMNGHGKQVTVQNVIEGYCAEKPTEPKESHYDFKGWYTNSGELFDFDTPITSNITLHARWEVDPAWWMLLIGSINTGTYTVTFESNGGSAVASQTVKSGETATIPATPTKDNYTFAGWFTDSALTVEYDFATAVTKNITLYAKWAANVIGDSDDDNDGIGYDWEILFGLDPNSDDTDKDGLKDALELDLALEPTKPDSDDDGILDGDEDTDGDGLTNLEELSNKTDPSDADTDNDGLNDSEEINTYNTDPLKYDTDGDGAADGWEIVNSYDPLTYNDSFIVSETKKEDQIEVSVTLPLDGENINSLSIEPIVDNLLIDETIPGYIGSPFDFSVDGEFDEAVITFNFNEALLEKEFFKPTIYYFNEETQLLEELETSVVGNTASAKVNHFSTYILLNKTEFDKVWESEIKPPDYSSEINGLDVVFVIDSSGSMSSNDNSNLRLQAAKNFVDKLGETDRAAVVDFDTSATLYQEFTSDHELLYAAINKVNKSGGTNLGRGISKAIEQFTSDTYTREDAYKYIIFLTDGDGSYSTSYTTQAAENNIVIYTIGLGNGVKEAVLKGIADGTGGKYYFASKADVLQDIYDQVAKETVDYVTDSNNDKISDYYTKFLCDGTLRIGLGKVTPFYGLSFDEIQANADYDNDGLLNGEELVVKFDENDKTIYVWMFSDPTSSDSDFDGIDDNCDRDTTSVDSNRFKANVKHETGGTTYKTTADFIVKYDKFFKDNTDYYQELAELASLYALDMYSTGHLDFYTYNNGKSGINGSTQSQNGIDFAALFGMDDGVNITASQLLSKYSTKVDGKTVDEDDVSEVSFSHQLVSYKGEKREIFFLTVRGTNGTQAEWSSNFDIGYDGDEYYDKVGKNHPDWKNKTNHKGFDVATNRIINAFNEYVSDLIAEGKINSDTKRSIFITGHSRGAAIANILGAHFEDDPLYTSYTYTMATPLTTTANNANSYKSIFNIVNKDDLVTYLPLDDWGFDWYGQTLEISVKDKYEDSMPFVDRSNSFEGYFNYDYDSNGYLTKTINSFQKIVYSRKDYYTLDTVSGDGEIQEGLTHTGDYYTKFMKQLKDFKMDKYCEVTKSENFLGMYTVKVVYCPAYMAQNVANLAAADGIETILDLLSIDLKGEYSNARTNFAMGSGKTPIPVVGGMEHPHMPSTYYLITSETPYQNFAKNKRR